MKSHFTSQFFINNRQKLRQEFSGTEPIIIAANGLLQRGGDSTYAFSQDANFWYLTGIDEPDLILVMDGEDDYLIVPTRSGVREAFDGVIEARELTSSSGIKKIYNDTAGWQKLESGLKKFKNFATVAPPPAYVEQYGIYTNPARTSLIDRVAQRRHDLEHVDVGQTLARLRMVKQPAELKAIQSAIDITDVSLKNATKLNMLSKYTYEYELEAEVRAGFRGQGATGDAFEPIVAGGQNACTLHNVTNNGKFRSGELILADVGAEVEHYAADITRVYSRAKPTQRQKNVYDAVLEVQQFAIDMLKPGTMPKEYEQSVEHFMGQKLKQLKLIKQITHENVRKFYPHSTSHFLGLNVHDVGDYTQPLQAGNVMTVEPGIYIHAEAIGVRIEDDVQITKTGNKILSHNIPKKLA